MKFLNMFSMTLLAIGAKAAAVANRQIVDVCAFVNADLLLDVAGVTKDFGALDLCLCGSALPVFITTNLVAIAAVEALDSADVIAALTALINAAPPCTPGPSSRIKRDTYILSDNVCPAGMTLCGVQSGWSKTAWECIDTERELESCGGCSVGILGTVPSGVDCTAIEGVNDVSCVHGKCEVQTCAHGYEVSDCGRICVRTNGHHHA